MEINSKSFIVFGEARESDTEEEIDFSEFLSHQIERCKGKIVSGEAPESDEDSYENPENLKNDSQVISSQQQTSSGRKLVEHQSILVKKLCERNASLHKNFNEFIRQTTALACSELNATNQKLLRCQIQMQENAEFLKIINSNLTLLDDSTKTLLDSNTLPSIKINDNSQKSP